MSTDRISLQSTALEFKSASLNVPVLQLSGTDFETIDQQLLEKVAQAPEFFKNSPLIIDFQKLTNKNLSISVKAIVELVRGHGFMPIGIRGGNEAQNFEAFSLNLPIHSLHGINTPLADKKAVKITPADEAEKKFASAHILENRVIDQPVRSGQQVYAKGDLIVTATVSAGAELMAEGNIHVYGSLRGKALAGVPENTKSRIFCSDFQAELISIAGIYQLSDNISKYQQHKPVEISLDNRTLIIKNI